MAAVRSSETPVTTSQLINRNNTTYKRNPVVITSNLKNHLLLNQWIKTHMWPIYVSLCLWYAEDYKHFPPTRALTLWRSVLMNVPDRPQIATPFICFTVAAMKWQLTAPIHDKVAPSDPTISSKCPQNKSRPQSFYFVLWPTNAQLFHKLSHSYKFRHYRAILRELEINTLPSYTSISNAAVGNTIYN